MSKGIEHAAYAMFQAASASRDALERSNTELFERVVALQSELAAPTPERLRAWAEWFEVNKPDMDHPHYMPLALAGVRLTLLAAAIEASEKP